MAEYVIFNNLVPILNSAPFKAGVNLLEMLHIAKHEIKQEKPDPGFEVHTLNPKLFIKIFAKTLAMAGENGQDIIALDDSSYFGLLFTKEVLRYSEKNIDEVEKLLSPHGLSCNKLANILHINEIFSLNEALRYIKNNIKHSFKGFHACIHFGAEQNRPLTDLSSIFDVLELKRIFLENEHSVSGYELFSCSPNIAMKMGAEILFEAFDNGSDFLIVNDIRTFTFFDSLQRKIAKDFGRDIRLPILSLSQIILLSIGVTNKQILGFDKHAVPPNFI